MRFSDMMGSGAEQSPTPGASESAPSESEAAIAEALAPYLDAPLRDPEPVAPVAPVEASVPAAAAPAPFSAPIAAPAPITAPTPVVQVVDYAPLSDDLLPRRR